MVYLTTVENTGKYPTKLIFHPKYQFWVRWWKFPCKFFLALTITMYFAFPTSFMHSISLINTAVKGVVYVRFFVAFATSHCIWWVLNLLQWNFDASFRYTPFAFGVFFFFEFQSFKFFWVPAFFWTLKKWIKFWNSQKNSQKHRRFKRNESKFGKNRSRT